MIFLFFGGLLFCCASVFLYRRETDFVVCGTLGMCFYFVTYVVITAILFFGEAFSLYRATVLTLLFSIVIFGFRLYVNKSKGLPELVLDIKESGASYLIILILMLIFSGSFGYFGMGQDQGVYQVEAINLMNGRNLWHDSIEEYEDIQDGEYKEFYKESVQSLLGFNVLGDDYRGLLGIEDTGKLEGFYHGIPTFAAVLALSGKLFGLENLMLFQKVFYAVSLLLLEFILKRQNVTWWMRGILLLVFGISPEVVWISKSSLTEGFMAVLILLYIFFIVDPDYDVKRFSILPIIAFCLWHLSAFSIAPVFFINYIFLYIKKNNPGYLRLATILSIGLAASMWMEYVISPTYFYGNMIKMADEFGQVIPIRLIPYIPFVIAAIMIVICIIVSRIGKTIYKNLNMAENVMLALVSAAMILYFCEGGAYWGNLNFPRLIGVATITAYATLTGFALLPLCILCCIISIRSTKNGDEYYLVSNLLAWTVLFYSMVLRIRVISYYYNSRYIMPYLSIIIVMFGLIYKNNFFKNRLLRKVTNIYMILGPIIGIFIMIPFANIIRINQDDTNLEWRVLNNVINNVGDDGVVFVDSDEMLCFFYPLRAKGAHVYPVMGDIDNTMDIMNMSGESDIYYLSQTQVYEDDWRYEIVYKDTSPFQLDDMLTKARVIFWPKDFAQKGINSHILYKTTGDEPVISASSGCFWNGWSANSSNYRWMNNKEASLYANLIDNTYDMEVVFGDRIPFELISIDEVEVKVFVNGKYVDNVIIDSESKGFNVRINDAVVTEGRNEVTFQTSDMWSPAEYGSADSSYYSFSVDTVAFSII